MEEAKRMIAETEKMVMETLVNEEYDLSLSDLGRSTAPAFYILKVLVGRGSNLVFLLQSAVLGAIRRGNYYLRAT
ncbi:hypothetical protein K440DRAFT_615817 [Wilcoxina mikolae CBS 423.85]|nr:hypothetical protein K440DRAFT_615817 [Wilcoxina mikolae CBS 423.85]